MSPPGPQATYPPGFTPHRLTSSETVLAEVIILFAQEVSPGWGLYLMGICRVETLADESLACSTGSKKKHPLRI